jgi:predicted transcriptional regulator
VIILDEVPMVSVDQRHSFNHIRGQVARVLLECSADSPNERPQLTQRDIATTLGVGWDMVHLSLKSLCSEGIIKLDRNRLVIKKPLLEKLVENAKPVIG